MVGKSGGWLRITYPYNGWVSGNMIGTDCRQALLRILEVVIHAQEQLA
ncbi:hypothetical protein [Chroogloeocystis siderophila]|nr:hypothetical protein [Chroogloeocystis siderophila]